MLKGKTVIELTDIETGKVERFEDENMFTNALDNVINQAPFWFNNMLLDRSRFNGDEDTRLTPIWNKALGGLLLFSEPIEEDPDNLYAPLDNMPIGIGSVNSVTIPDERRGEFDASYEPSADGKSMTYVWNFSTSAANGIIKNVCLTSARGGMRYLDNRTCFLHENRYNSNGFNMGFVRCDKDAEEPTDSLETPRGFLLGADETGIYVLRTSNNTILRANTNKEIINLNDTTYFEEIYDVTEDTQTTLSNVGYWGYENGNLYYVISEVVGGQGFIDSGTVVKVNLSTKERTTLGTIAKPSSGYGIRIRNGSLKGRTSAVIDGTMYIPYYNTSETESNYGFISFGRSSRTFTYSGVLHGEIGTRIYGFSGMIATRYWFMDINNNDESNLTKQIELDEALNGVPCGLIGCWAIMGDYSSFLTSRQARLCATVFMPYLATINNLKTPIEKLPTKTMRVTYTVTNY